MNHVPIPPTWGTSFPFGKVRINEFGTNDGVKFMRDAPLSSVDSGSLSRGYRAQAQMEPSALDLDVGEGNRATHP